ncbi:trypsin alpha-4 [Dermatophagoides pteronyssinus]|uniref:Uncharacterized protein n=2 Tax=Dermatophagoides pteronyssinus TaxID=6956 RepID=A0ABQ8JF00_DERPT|nr:trypsin alpha-3-like [Dermatophagoides pteronyssinus]KAH9421017.1 hypothetical protein DERP_001458 [Dermatophagoides pteronyssinus]
MKFIILFALIAIGTSVAIGEQAIRLPLPDAITEKFPWMINEPLNDERERIVGGSNASPGDAVYQIALFRKDSFTCGGSLISSRTVLTAAHCVFGDEATPSYFKIRYNTLDRTNGPTIGVSKIYRHNLYSSSTIDYDVATLILSQPFTPSANADIIPLTTSEPADGTKLQITGWGRLKSGGTLPTILQIASVTKMSRTKCSSTWGSVNAITNRMLCAHNSKQASCNGDSGGPLVSNGHLVGVVSWGPSTCLSTKYPTIYSNVANLRNWIISNTV